MTASPGPVPEQSATPVLPTELGWAIASAPLLTDCLRPHQFFTALECRQFWQQWQPAGAESLHVPRRLGRRFESLWQFWLAQHPRWQLLATGLVAADGKLTRGEFDLLLRDRHTGLTEHWELAVKFYLGEGDLADPGNWWGPQRQDRLSQKLAKLCDQQLMLQHTVAGQAALARVGVQVQQTRAIVKGRLFYPLAQRDAQAAFAAPGHERGCWATGSDWRDWLTAHAELQALPLPREHWLAGLSVPASAPPFSALLQQADWPPFSTFLLSSGELAMIVAGVDWCDGN